MDDGVRCPNVRPAGDRYAGTPCGKRLGASVTGLYRTACPRCGGTVLIVRPGRAVIRGADGRLFEVVATVRELARNAKTDG